MTRLVRSLLALSAGLVVLAGLSPSASAQAIKAENVATGFVRPVFVTAPTGDPDRLFVVEKRGTIRIIKSGVVLATPFLDIQSSVLSSGNEQGLLGLAFPSDYFTTGYFYVYYIRAGGSGISQVARYSVTANPDLADAASELRIYNTSQPFTNHNGGHIEFGPNDGFLYLGLGDGGSANDPGNRAQTGTVPLGKMLRIDPTGDDFPGDPSLNYAVPGSNPFVGNPNFLDEIWAYGLRNPWRNAFDRETGDLYIADVGQNAWEEIDFQPAASPGGESYGWRVREGTRCFSTSNPNNCNNTSTCSTSHVQPIHEYNHSTNGFSCSVTGGRVYNGGAIPGLTGTYFFADYCSNQVYSLKYNGAFVTNLTNRTSELNPPIGGGTISAVTAIGKDGVGELYIVKETTSGSNNTIFKIVPDPAALDSPQVERPRAFGMSDGTPNPFTASTQFQVQLDRTGELDVAVYDAAGRLVRTLRRGVNPAGSVPVEWNGRDVEERPVPAGVYFVRAATRGLSETKRVVLVH